MTLSKPDHVLYPLFVHLPFSCTKYSLLKKFPTLLLMLIGFLLFLPGCATGPSLAPVLPQASVPVVRQPSPSPPAETVLYQADWSHGLAGWTAQGWEAAQGQLMSNSSGTATLTIPYHLTISDYAVEIRVQFIRSVPPYGGSYEIVTPTLAGKDGYEAGIFDLKPPGPRPFGDHPQATVFLNPSVDMNPGSGIPQDYEPGSGWHIYRVEVRGNEARWFDNGTQIGRASSQQPSVLSNGPIEFRCTLALLRMSDLRLLTL